MPFSHHSHSGQFCRHAEGTLEEVVIEAIKQGFKVYGLTEHVPRYRTADLYPEEAGLSLSALALQFEDFLQEAHRLKVVYASQICLLVGLETEYITPKDLDELDVLLEKHGDRIEYIVGSVHHVNEIPIDLDKPTYETALSASGSDVGQFLCHYFDAHFDLLKRFKPEVVAHLDLCRLYTPDLRLNDFTIAWTKLQRNVDFAIEYGALFELNAAAFRRGWTTAYPGEDIVKLIQSQGGKFTLSDDSHGPHRVGLDYGDLATYARNVGIAKIWYLSQSQEGQPRASSGRKVNAVEFAGENWWESEFWKK